VLAEKVGERSLLVGGTVLGGAAFAGMAFAGGFFSLFLVILLIGLGSAVQHPLASAIISQAYAASRRRTALGIYNFFGDVGKMVVALGVATAAGVIGWQATAIGYGVIVTLAGVILLLVLWRYALGQPRPAAMGFSEAATNQAGRGLQLTN